MEPWLLILNVGSSSVKFAVYEKRGRVRRVRGAVSGLPEKATFTVEPIREPPSCPAPMDLERAVSFVVDWAVTRFGAAGLRAVGHRIVHGGRDYAAPAILTEDTAARLQRLSPLAPLHQPFGLVGVAQAKRYAPHAVQIGCFDTAFHADRPEVDKLLPLPRDFAARGVVRYGFHGLSYEHIAAELSRNLGAPAGGRTVAAHLGAGASLCAMDKGRSIATTMGFTPLGGIPMATRPGDLDPGVILYLLEEERMNVEDVRELLYHRSGLLGLSGESSDFRALLGSSTNEAAQAVDLYVTRVAREVAAMASALGGLETLVFTGGVGEQSSQVRALICRACAWMGVQLHAEANEAHRTELHAPSSSVRVLRIPADEEAVIAAHVVRALRTGAADPGS